MTTPDDDLPDHYTVQSESEVRTFHLLKFILVNLVVTTADFIEFRAIIIPRDSMWSTVLGGDAGVRLLFSSTVSSGLLTLTVFTWYNTEMSFSDWLGV